MKELSNFIEYDEAVEFYTDFAKMENKEGFESVEPFMLELIGLLANKKENGN